jgi:hypothetical protein
LVSSSVSNQCKVEVSAAPRSQILCELINRNVGSAASRSASLRSSYRSCSAAVSETAAKNQGFGRRTATHSKAQGGNAATISWSALNWSRRLVLISMRFVADGWRIAAITYSSNPHML